MKRFIIMFVKSIGTPSHIIAMVIWPGNMLWLFAVRICRGNLPQLFDVAIYREYLPWVFVVFLCEWIFFLCKQSFLNWKQTFFIWEQNFSFMRISFITVFLFAFAVAVMGHHNYTLQLSTTPFKTLSHIASI